jgi:hypothetical protein
MTSTTAIKLRYNTAIVLIKKLSSISRLRTNHVPCMSQCYEMKPIIYGLRLAALQLGLLCQADGKENF